MADPSGGCYRPRATRREKGGLVTIRQLLLVLHYGHDCWLRRRPAYKNRAEDFRHGDPLVGLMLTGILVAVAVHSATVALAAHDAAIKVK